MPAIIEFGLTILVPALLALLIIAKSDKQSIHMLEGKLFKRGIPVDAARESYRSHTRKSTVIIWTLGFIIVTFGVSSADLHNLWQFGISIVGSMLIMFGIFGRLNAFRAASEELEFRERNTR